MHDLAMIIKASEIFRMISITVLVMNHQFNWWFDYAPIRGLCLQRLKGGCLKHLYRPASKRGYLLVSSLLDSSFCC